MQNALRRAPSLNPVPGDDVAVPAGAALGDALLGGVVDVDQAPAFGVTLLPLEVVQQRPDVVALQLHTGRDGAVGGGEVVAQEGDPGQVVDVPVGGDLVEARHAVLGDRDGHR